MTESLTSISWDAILTDPGVIALDGRHEVYVRFDPHQPTFMLALNRVHRTLFFARHAPPDATLVRGFSSQETFLLLNPDFERLKILVSVCYLSRQETLHLRIVKPAENPLFQLHIHPIT